MEAKRERPSPQRSSSMPSSSERLPDCEIRPIGPARVVVRGDMELRERVEDADAVGAEHDRARSAHALDQRALAPASLLALLGQSRGDHDQRASALGERLLDRLLEARLGHGNDDGLDRARRHRQGSRAADGPDLAAAPVDQVHGSAVCAAQRGSREPVAPLARIGRRAEHRHGARGRRAARGRALPSQLAPRDRAGDDQALDVRAALPDLLRASRRGTTSPPGTRASSPSRRASARRPRWRTCTPPRRTAWPSRRGSSRSRRGRMPRRRARSGAVLRRCASRRRRAGSRPPGAR